MKKYKKKYYTGGRADYREGGRVGYARGEKVRDGIRTVEDNERPGLPPKKGKPVAPPGGPKVGGPVPLPGGPVKGPPIDKPIQPPSIGGIGGGASGPIERPPITPPPMMPPRDRDDFEQRTPLPPKQTPASDEAMRETTAQEGDPVFDAARRERIRETGLQIEASATGDVPDAAKIPAAQRVGVDRFGRPLKYQTQKETTMADPTTVGATTAQQVTKEGVTTGAVKTAQTPEDIETAKMVAAQVSTSPDVQAAIGNLSPDAVAKVQEISELSGPAEAARISESIANAAKAKDVEGILSSGAFAKDVVGVGANISEGPDAEAQSREAITGVPATDGQAAQIIGTVGYEAAQQRAVTGQAAKGAAASMVAEVGNIPQDIAAAIVEDPATVEAQVDTNPVEVNAAIAALPTEALVSSQMESLLGGMEDGEVPMWARPAVDAVNAQMAQRGLSVSTVGRDALFNSIIQSAMPMAQSNAQALQSRAAQNLSNEQQANLQQATQEQQLRMQNLANRQDAASQTAQMSQQMRTMQSQFTQDAVMTTAQQQQQTRMANLQNQQQAAITNVQNQQQMNMQNLGNEQQLNMAELQIEANVEGANQAAVNQERMAEMQVAADFLSKNAGFKQQMDLANLSNDQQMRLANLSAQKQAG